MKLAKTASGKQTIRISKREWQDIGEKTGWIKISKHADFVENLASNFRNGTITAEDFLGEIKSHISWGWIGISKDPTVRKGIIKAINEFENDSDAKKAAWAIVQSISSGINVEEGFFD